MKNDLEPRPHRIRRLWNEGKSFSDIERIIGCTRLETLQAISEINCGTEEVCPVCGTVRWSDEEFE